MQTLGFLIDQASIVNLKMWNAQEDLYKVRRMEFKEFKSIYSSDDKLRELFDILKKACDLNVQRANVVDDIDDYVMNLVKDILNNSVDLSKLTQKKHKTY